MKCDFHVHTCYSYDSTSSPKQVVDIALKKGIDCLAITDHNKVEGAAEVIRYAQDKSILIIPGIEIKSREGDILGLGIEQVIPDGLSAEETIEKIKERGGLAIIAHPFGWPYAFKGDLKDFIGKMDGIEVFNAAVFPRANEKASEIVKKYNLAFTAGSDAHFPNSIGNAYLEIPGEKLSVKEVLKAVKDKKGKIGGKEVCFFEKIIDHIKRNISKLKTLC